MTAVRVTDVTKTYATIVGGKRRLLAMLGRRSGPGARTNQALKGVSFAIDRGESVGLIGSNGSGKSTALKILAGVAPATTGRVEVNGRITALLELGTGFHPEFTGRENLRYSAMLAGLGPTEIDEIEPDILDFCELGSVIDDPLKTYSTGMSMRLGFAVATAMRADVVLVDEVLSVGDAYFQLKSFERLKRVVSDGGTFILVAHDLGSILRTCQRVIWLDNGVIRADGPAQEVVAAYQEHSIAGEEARLTQVQTALRRGSDQPVRRLWFEDARGAAKHYFPTDAAVDVVADVLAPAGAELRFLARRSDHRLLLELRSGPMAASAGAVRAHLAPLQLGAGDIFWSAELWHLGQRIAALGEDQPVPMVIVAPVGDAIERGALRHATRWTVRPLP